MNEVGEKVFDALTTYCEIFGRHNVFIVTNASDGWVQETATKTAKAIEKESPLTTNWWQLICSSFICPDDTSALRIISARSLHERNYPNQTRKWKALVFQGIAICQFGLNQAPSPFDKNLIISIGDSLDEYQAASAVKTLLKRQNMESIMHRVKMIRSPSTRELAQQIGGISKLAKLFAIAQITEEQNISLEAYMRN